MINLEKFTETEFEKLRTTVDLQREIINYMKANSETKEKLAKIMNGQEDSIKDIINTCMQIEIIRHLKNLIAMKDELNNIISKQDPEIVSIINKCIDLTNKISTEKEHIDELEYECDTYIYNIKPINNNN